MRRLRAALVAAIAGGLMLLPVGAGAGPCPDPDQPCDPQPIDIKQEVCRLLGKC